MMENVKSAIRKLRQKLDVRDPIEQLTVRELEVLQCVAYGMTSEVAGEVLGISRRTVEIHRSHLQRKLGARTSAEAVRIAMVMGIDFQASDAA